MIYEYIKEDSRFSLTYFDKTKERAIAWEYGIPQILHMAGDKGGFFTEWMQMMNSSRTVLKKWLLI